MYNKSRPPINLKPVICNKYAVKRVNIILKTTAPPIPQKIIFFLCSNGNFDATIPIIMALSPAKTRSIKMICVKIAICSGVIDQ